jgi:hypothetical protein
MSTARRGCVPISWQGTGILARPPQASQFVQVPLDFFKKTCCTLRVVSIATALSTPLHALPVDDMEAWWLCFDTLRMADGELRRSDTLLADSGRQG